MRRALENAILASCLLAATAWAGQAGPAERPAGAVLSIRAAALRAPNGQPVSRWQSDQGHAALQSVAAARPTFVADAIGGRPAVRFDGGDFLSLGQVSELDFRPGQPFTIAVVYATRRGECGTFIAKGGGPEGGRAYQFYAAPGRLGGVAYGVRREAPARLGGNVALFVCDGAEATAYLNGQLALSFKIGAASSSCDVLIGARRRGGDNTGIQYPLKGDLAELAVYPRALSRAERQKLTSHLATRYGLTLAASPSATVARLVADGKALDAAERLLQAAHDNRLTDDLADVAAQLLGHESRFVRGVAEWAIAMKVGGENSGQALVWPKPKAPEWFARWMAVPAAARLEADWVRQAVSLGTHRDAARLLASVDAMVARAERMAAHGTVPAAAMADLRATRRRMATASDTAARQALWLAARRCLRAAVMAHHGLAAERLVFVKQFAAHTVRNITRSYPWKHKPGGDIFVLAGLKPDAGAEAVLKGRPGPGYVWGLDLWWDADRVVFAYASLPQWPPPVNTAHYLTEGNNVYKLRQEIEPLHIWEAPLDGSAPRQLTRHRYWSDFEPTYCASGDIVFASDRCGRSAQCGQESYDHANPNLYIMSPDGSRVRRLTDNKDIDRYPHSLDDGRIAYTHWEYQERHFMEVHAIWTVRPDGTMSDALFKHHMRAPCGLRDTRSIPGTGRLVSIATGHHTFAYGPVVIADPQQGTNAEAGIEILTPGVRVQEGKMAGTPSAGGGVADRGGLYHTPWALSDRCFLVSYAYARPRCPAPGGVDSNGFGIYLIDTYGNKELVTRDPLLSCVFPIPLRRRVRPPIPADVVSPGQQAAVCYVTDVCDGMPEVPRGTVKYIRVAQHVGWPLDDVRGAMHYIPGVAGQRHLGFRSWSPVRVLGDVPVEGDGSASFLVPSDTAVYFQALDARHMEVRRMRSMVSFKAGETRGCRGCHESEARAPAQAAAPMALRKPPRAPTPPPWGAQRLLGYEWLVQPILDRRCVRCHDGQQPKTPFDLRATRAPDGLLRSYHTLLGSVPGSKKRGRALVSCSDRFSNASVSKPLEFGSHKSPFILALLDALHQKEAGLSDAEWLSLVTWVDANAPYHDAFYNKRRPDGGKPKRDVVPKLPVVTVDRGR